jgi:hypothetical protein
MGRLSQLVMAPTSEPVCGQHTGFLVPVRGHGVGLLVGTSRAQQLLYYVVSYSPEAPPVLPARLQALELSGDV